MVYKHGQGRPVGLSRPNQGAGRRNRDLILLERVSRASFRERVPALSAAELNEMQERVAPCGCNVGVFPEIKDGIEAGTGFSAFFPAMTQEVKRGIYTACPYVRIVGDIIGVIKQFRLPDDFDH